ncbi:MAG: hypothetical protein ACOCU8_02395 [Patescibacteria group bacterium]
MMKKVNLTKEFIIGLIAGLALAVFVYQAFTVWQIRSDVAFLTTELNQQNNILKENNQLTELLAQIMMEAGLVPEEYIQE